MGGGGEGGCSFSRHKHEKKTSASQANKKISGNGAELNEWDITPIAKVFKVDTNGMENKMA